MHFQTHLDLNFGIQSSFFGWNLSGSHSLTRQYRPALPYKGSPELTDASDILRWQPSSKWPHRFNVRFSFADWSELRPQCSFFSRDVIILLVWMCAWVLKNKINLKLQLFSNPKVKTDIFGAVHILIHFNKKHIFICGDGLTGIWLVFYPLIIWL